VAGATVFGYGSALPVDQAFFCTVGGVVLLCSAPWLAGATARTEARLAPALLGPSRNERLRQRVEHLAESRTDLIEAVDSERRRIERDLHDGTQQRLVSLAVNLGLARATLTDLPDDARTAIDEAHREAKEAIAELNDLVRGLHPAVLEDRGLDAALSGLAARVPLPVGLRVDIGERAAPVVESVAYFVVSEALTNVTKHARATRAEVTVERIGKVLRVNVTDDGSGGADASAGSGLNGLAKRVGSVDGTFRVSSPAGGPTTLTAELPCEL
jgi:signal transduction histidine kinase